MKEAPALLAQCRGASECLQEADMRRIIAWGYDPDDPARRTPAHERGAALLLIAAMYGVFGLLTMIAGA